MDQAIEKCSSDTMCTGIKDFDCDGGPFELCKMFRRSLSKAELDKNSYCAYKKTHTKGRLQNKIHNFIEDSLIFNLDDLK